MDLMALYDLHIPAFIPGVIPWLLFTAAGFAFCWGGSGIAVSLADRRWHRD